MYISEAHPSDEWSFNDGVSTEIAQHRTLEERISVSQEFMNRHHLNGHFAVDLMANSADLDYDAHPERLYVVRDGKVAFAGGPGPFEYSIEAVSSFLENECKQA